MSTTCVVFICFVLICIYYFGSRVFRTSHTCIYQSTTYLRLLPSRKVCSFSNCVFTYCHVFSISVCVSLERAIHSFISSHLFQPRAYTRLLFRFACFYNDPTCIYPLQTFPTACLYAYYFGSHVFIIRKLIQCMCNMLMFGLVG